MTMELLYGTGNSAKISVMRQYLGQLNIEIIGLEDMKKRGFALLQAPETGRTPLENARQKAQAYYDAFHIPVFSCDSGLYFDDVPEEIQPGVHVRTIGGKYLTDEEMLAYYTGLVRRYGRLTAYYKNAICFIQDEEHRYESMSPSLESGRFWLTDVPHSSIRKKGFPLDSISLDMHTGKYFYDLPPALTDGLATGEGFKQFFQKVLNE